MSAILDRKAQLSKPTEGRASRLLVYLAWGALIYNVAVILWGAVVRISGSGAGCGDHWPLCDGAVVPLSFTAERVIEYSHRLTSGASGLLAVGLIALAFRQTAKGHPVRLGAILSFVFILLEGLVGGVQVLLGLTADSTDPARGLFQGVHLANTFVLLAALLLTALWASGFSALRLRSLSAAGQRTLWTLVVGLLLSLLVGMTGAITALGDLLFKPAAGTPLDTLRNDFGLDASFFERLRILHPLLAVATSAYLVWMALRVREWVATPQVAFWSRLLLGTVAAQVLAGVVNVALRAPDVMQLLHLLLACMLWLMTFLLGYFALLNPASLSPAATPLVSEPKETAQSGALG